MLKNLFKREVITVLMACSSLIRIQVDNKERFLATIKWLINEKLLSSLIYQLSRLILFYQAARQQQEATLILYFDISPSMHYPLCQASAERDGTVQRASESIGLLGHCTVQNARQRDGLTPGGRRWAYFLMQFDFRHFALTNARSHDTTQLTWSFEEFGAFSRPCFPGCVIL